MLAGCAVLAGCGVPADHAIHSINPAASPRRPFSPPTPTDSRRASRTPAVYFRNDKGVLAPAPRAVPEGTAKSMLQALLDQLAKGPAQTELHRGLDSVLPPTMTLEVTAVSDRRATVAMTGELPSTDQDVAVAQIVLSATTVQGVNSVLFTRAGGPMRPPLPGGVLALPGRALTARDYQPLITPTPTR